MPAADSESRSPRKPLPERATTGPPAQPAGIGKSRQGRVRESTPVVPAIILPLFGTTHYPALLTRRNGRYFDHPAGKLISGRALPLNFFDQINDLPRMV